MYLADDYVPILDLHAASQPKLFRILVPGIKHVQLLRRWFLQVLHSADNLNDARPTRTIEATGFHLNPRFLSGFQQEFSWLHLRRGICRQNSHFGHTANQISITRISLGQFNVNASSPAETKRALGTQWRLTIRLRGMS